MNLESQQERAMKTSPWTGLATGSLILALAWPGSSQAHDPSAALSQASGLPLALSVAAPVALLSAGATLAVISVQASAAGTVWVLQRASDGAQMSLTLSGQAVSAVGSLVTVVVLGSGWVLSQAGQALCFIPNEIGASLLYNETVTR
jgi:hypothetical protein